MSRTLLVLAALAVGGVVLIVAYADPSPPARSPSGADADPARGAYVARLAACITCHTDTENGGPVLAGGAPMKTPFGIFHPPNITPDPVHGIGAWSVADFSRAMTRGRGPDGRHYSPAFPFPFYTRMTDRDIADLWAAIQTVPPVAQPTPDHDLVFPANLDLAARLWQRIFFRGQASPDGDGTGDALARGRYLAEGPAHCGACHTPRNLLGGRDTDRRYAGGTAGDGEKAPPITARALGENGWSEDDLVYALRTGIMPDGDTFGGSMAKVVSGSTRFWSEADLRALAAYVMQGP